MKQKNEAVSVNKESNQKLWGYLKSIILRHFTK